jgi:hypothetical protein
LPMFHLNLDLWTSKVTKEKYMGVRIFWLQMPDSGGDASFHFLLRGRTFSCH